MSCQNILPGYTIKYTPAAGVFHKCTGVIFLMSVAVKKGYYGGQVCFYIRFLTSSSNQGSGIMPKNDVCKVNEGCEVLLMLEADVEVFLFLGILMCRQDLYRVSPDIVLGFKVSDLHVHQ